MEYKDIQITKSTNYQLLCEILGLVAENNLSFHDNYTERYPYRTLYVFKPSGILLRSYQYDPNILSLALMQAKEDLLTYINK